MPVTDCFVKTIHKPLLLNISGKLYKNYKNKGVCKEIRMDDLSDDFKKKFRGEDQKYMKTLLAQKTIDLFVKRGLLKKRGNVYYLLNTNRRLSWNNIKQLKMHHLNDLNKVLIVH